MLTIKKSDIDIERKKVQIELIRDCINKSREIIIATAAKQSLRNATFFISRLRHLLPSEKHIKEMNQELDNYSFELKRTISIMLRHIVGNREIVIEDLFWFSAADLKSGYVLLYPHVYTKFSNYVLFIVEARDTFDGIIYLPGDIKPFREVNHVLASMKGLTDKDLGIGFNYATKKELLNELSTLSSILKSKQHE